MLVKLQNWMQGECPRRGLVALEAVPKYFTSETKSISDTSRTPSDDELHKLFK